MAYVKILRNRNVVALEQYLFKGRESDDPLEMNGCFEGYVSEQFIGTQVNFGEKENFDAIHVIQSWGEKDSSKIAPEDFAKIGKKMIENLFPGHQFCIVTHTEHGHVHNHIMVNPVHSETGRRIHDKKHILYDIQAKSDELCLENGLSIIEAQSRKTWEKTPEHVREMKRKGGFSWVLDLKEKADFARTLATSFDEYAGILNQFGIQVKVENKTIGYFYPDKRQKRGDNYGLGEKYDKRGLIEQFKENYVRFYEAGFKTTPIENVNFSEHWKFHRSSDEFYVPSYRYKNLVIPHELIRTVQGIDLKEYGERMGQTFNVDSEGKAQLRGRTHVLVNENRWVNEKTKAQGGAFEFINYCHNESWLETLKRFDITGKVQDVQNIAEIKTPSFKAFYAPQPFREKDNGKKDLIGEAFFEASKVLASLTKHRKVHIFPSGKVKFVSNENLRASITVHNKKGVWFTRKPKGATGTFFSRFKNAKNPLLIFEDPVAFLASGKALDRILNDRSNVNVVVPLKPLDEFLKEREEFIRAYPKCRIVRNKDRFLWGLPGAEKEMSDDTRSEIERLFDAQYKSLEELLKELILGRSL